MKVLSWQFMYLKPRSYKGQGCLMLYLYKERGLNLIFNIFDIENGMLFLDSLNLLLLKF